MPTKILLTGASGFIGKNLFKILDKKNVKLTPIAHKNIKDGFINCNLLDKKKVSNLVKGNDCIIHCAGYTNTSINVDKNEKNKIWKYNYETSKILINEAKKNKVKKFIYISSAKVLGEFSKKMIMENSKPKPKTEYAKSKLYTENFLISIGKTYNIDVICLRPTVVYGNGCKGNLRNLLRIMNMNLLPEIKKTNNKISLLHVKDLCEAIIKVIFSKKRGGLFVVSGPSDLSLDEIISFMRKAINKKETYFKINLNILILINIILKKINLFGIFNRISLLIDKFFRSSFYESKKFSKCYNWKPKVYPSDGFFEMINGE